MSHTYPPLLPITADKLVARIGESNSASIALFAKLGFVVTKRVKVFEEVEMRLATLTDCELDGHPVPRNRDS